MEILASPEGASEMEKSEPRKSRVVRVATILEPFSATAITVPASSSSLQIIVPSAWAVRVPPLLLLVQSRLLRRKLPAGERVISPVVEEMV